jgi:catechol 2,3-dioxygenase-like lactoylglutathione lyase family enzyme
MSASVAEDDHAKELMAKWDAENPVDDSNIPDADIDEPLGYDDMLEKYRRDVNVTDNAFDHFVLGTSNLDKAVDDFEKLTGVRPLMVVSHNGCGTKSARVAFQSCAFIEFLGPDPKQTPDTTLAQALSRIPEGELVPVHYSVRTTRSEELKKSWDDLGFEVDNVTMIAKDRGMPWKWSLFFFEGHEDGGLMPFYSDWGDAHHAAGRLPIVGEIKSVIVRAPAGSKVHKVVGGVTGIDVGTGDNFFECSFTSAKGTHTYSVSSLVGITFPK